MAMAQMIVIYELPRNPAAFDRHFFEVHLPLAKQLPGLRKLETSRGPIISLYGASEVHLVATLNFDSLSDINAAVMSECGRACAADRRQLAPQADAVQMFLFDTHQIVTGPQGQVS
jgi:uncharacterized protein (TIGR02118 family)